MAMKQAAPVGVCPRKPCDTQTCTQVTLCNQSAGTDTTSVLSDKWLIHRTEDHEAGNK